MDLVNDSENGRINKKKKKAWIFWIGITILYLIIIATIFILDFALHCGLLVGVKILALIHAFFIVCLVSCYAKKKMRRWERV